MFQCGRVLISTYWNVNLLSVETVLPSDKSFNLNLLECDIVKLSITLDTLTARIMKLSSDSQSRIEPTPFYSWWDTTDRRADSAVAPVAHEISPDHRF